MVPVLRNHPFCQAKVVSQDRWSFIAGTYILQIAKVGNGVEYGSSSQRSGLAEDCRVCHAEVAIDQLLICVLVFCQKTCMHFASGIKGLFKEYFRTTLGLL